MPCSRKAYKEERTNYACCELCFEYYTFGQRSFILQRTAGSLHRVLSPIVKDRMADMSKSQIQFLVLECRWCDAFLSSQVGGEWRRGSTCEGGRSFLLTQLLRMKGEEGEG
jgi:hypothetical protein